MAASPVPSSLRGVPDIRDRAGRLPRRLPANCHECRRAVLWNVGLHPDVQGQGFGAELVRQVQQTAADRGIPVKLSVFVTNPRAEAFYARLGFTQTGQTEALIAMTWRPSS